MTKKPQPQVDHKLLLSAVWESSADAMRISDSSGIVFSVNKAYCTLTGFERDALIGKSFDMVYDKKERAGLMKYYKEFISSGKDTVRNDKRVTFADGRECILEASYSNLDMSGEKYILTISRDITEFMQAEEGIRISETKYRSLVENALTGIFTSTLSGKILFSNNAMCEIFEYSSTEEILKAGAESLYKKAEDREKFINEIETYNQISNYELELVTKKGNPRYVILNAFLSGDIITGILLDITEMKQSEKQLQISEITYRGLIDSVTEAIYVQDENGKFLDINLAVEKLYGYERDYFIGKTPEFLSAPGKNDFGMIMNSIHSAFNGIPQNFEFWGIKKDGTVFPKEISLSSGMYHGKKVIIAVARDITDRKRAEEADRSLRKQLRAVLDTVPSYIFAKDYDGNFLMVNKSLADLFGVSPEEVVGKTDSDYGATKEQIEGYIAADRKVIDSGEELLIKEEQVLRKDGSLGWFQTNKVPYIHPGIDKPAILGVAVDITDRKRVETILQESEKRYRTLFDLSPAGIMLLDENGIILKINESLSKSLQYTEEELSGKHVSVVVPPENYKKINEDIKQILTGDTLEHEVINLRKDGSKCIFYLCETTIKLPDDRRGILAVVTDITDKKRAEIAVREAMEKAEASDKLKTAFLNNISHELRTPLNGILGFGELISKPGISEKEKQTFLSYLRSSSTRLMDTITNYMDISLIVSNNMKVNLIEFKPDILVHQIIEKYNKLFRKKEIDFTVNIPDNLNRFILKSDPELINKIFIQLLNNAAEYTEQGHVEIGIEVKPDYIEFYVKDTGIGIEKDAHEYIFDYFRQESEGIGRFHEGSGLGLSIANGITELLGGKIWFESEKGKGSTFYFNIPINNNTDNVALKENLKQIYSGKKEPVILIVEDEELNSKLVLYILQRLSLKTILATNGIQAIEICREHPEISLILMDIKLPFMDGLEATRQIKVIRKDLPVIAITAYAMVGDENIAFNAGCDDYITKPIDRELLIKKLGRFGIAINEQEKNK